MSVYIELDALLDTRISVIETMGPIYKKMVLHKDGYFKRLSDDFCKLNKSFPIKLYKELWRKRDSTILRMSTVTPVIYELKKLRLDLTALRQAEVMVMLPSLVVNHYPYKLTSAEKALFIEMISDVTGFTQIDFISLLPDFITPDFINEDFSHVILYDMDHWMTLHARGLTDRPNPNTQFITPLLLVGGKHPRGTLDCLVEEARTSLRGVLDYRPQEIGLFSFMTEETPPPQGKAE